MIYARIRRNAEARAILRDLDDRAHLQALQAMVIRWATELAPLAYPLSHPYRRWSPEDLAEQLLDAHIDIQAELCRLTGPLVVEDAANDD